MKWIFFFTKYSYCLTWTSDRNGHLNLFFKSKCLKKNVKMKIVKLSWNVTKIIHLNKNYDRTGYPLKYWYRIAIQISHCWRAHPKGSTYSACLTLCTSLHDHSTTIETVANIITCGWAHAGKSQKKQKYRNNFSKITAKPESISNSKKFARGMGGGGTTRRQYPCPFFSVWIN